MRQRRGAGKEREHERDEIDLLEHAVARRAFEVWADAGECRAAAGNENCASRSRLGEIDGGLGAICFRDRLRTPQHNLAVLNRRQILNWTQWSSFACSVGQATDLPYRKQIGLAWPSPLLLPVHKGFRVHGCDGLSLSKQVFVFC